VSQPVINIQLDHNEIGIKFSSFDTAPLEAVLERIKKLQFDAFSLGKLLIEYGDPTKKEAYRYGVRVPKNVDAQPFTNWLVEQLRTIQFDDRASWQVNHLPIFEWTGK
jgi:hypothetical protein